MNNVAGVTGITDQHCTLALPPDIDAIDDRYNSENMVDICPYLMTLTDHQKTSLTDGDESRAAKFENVEFTRWMA